MANEQCLNSAKREFLLDKRTEYENDEVLSKFLTSDKDDEYKYLIMNLLETDYSKCTYSGSYQAVLRKPRKEKNQAGYREASKDVNTRRKVDYYESNKEAIKQRQADYRESNKQNKIHYCKLCDRAFGTNVVLQHHLNSLKHRKNREREKPISKISIKNDDYS